MSHSPCSLATNGGICCSYSKLYIPEWLNLKMTAVPHSWQSAAFLSDKVGILTVSQAVPASNLTLPVCILPALVLSQLTTFPRSYWKASVQLPCLWFGHHRPKQGHQLLMSQPWLKGLSHQKPSAILPPSGSQAQCKLGRLKLQEESERSCGLSCLV